MEVVITPPAATSLKSLSGIDRESLKKSLDALQNWKTDPALKDNVFPMSGVAETYAYMDHDMLVIFYVRDNKVVIFDVLSKDLLSSKKENTK